MSDQAHRLKNHDTTSVLKAVEVTMTDAARIEFMPLIEKTLQQ